MKKRATKKAKKKSRGRPPVEEPMATIGLRCSTSQRERWQAVADTEGKSLSQWLRDLADAAADDALGE